MICELVNRHSEILTEPAIVFDFENPPLNSVDLAVNLTETMISKNGLGLAAPQIGIPYRVFALTGDPVTVCFNPRIVDKSTEEIYLDEGCLTFPGLIIKIKRPSLVRVRYTMANGETITQKLSGITARCFQHEIDHLNGILFLNRATLYHREKALKEWRKNG